MSYKQLISSSVHTILHSKPNAVQLTQNSCDGLNKSRRTILFGWVVSMIGIVTYCFVMLSDQQVDLAEALSANDSVGWMSALVILIGVGIWFKGLIKFLKEVDCSTI